VCAAGICCAILVGCSETLSDLNTQFGDAQAKPVKTSEFGKIDLLSNRHRGMSDPDDVVGEIRDDSLAFSPTGLDGLRFNTLIIPADAIRACSMICFADDDHRVALVVPSSGTTIMAAKAEKLIDWCFDREIPMISSKDRRRWQNRGVVPTASFAANSRQAYMVLAQKACQGF
jgi:hypothetical protein